ncbi:MAG TPA: hypothetical protein VE954_14095 [Oligoflexus sp.]|uniref:hypothetical protein n=1 Tax=Oligoflexus sp. TaxID=1971216 RepID=UPI002D6BF230|nr:hypothetical protein [Oligoflexus sp.]HYX34231.1 hypothetical protein [Oligoflexus sp.]
MILEEIKRSFASELTKTDTNPRSRRYSRDLKDAVLPAMRNHGLGVTDVTRTLGISATAVSNWVSSGFARAEFASDFTEQGFIAAKLVPLQEDVERPKAFMHQRLLTISLPSGVNLEISY